MDIITIPFSWLLWQMYTLFQNYGVALIMFSLCIKLILLPFGMKSKKSIMKSTRITPKVQELEKKYGSNKAKYNEEVTKLYREEGVKPLSGCLWNLIPFPILIALFDIIRRPFTTFMDLSSAQWTYVKETIFPALNIAVSDGEGVYEQVFYAEALHSNFDAVMNWFGENSSKIPEELGNFAVALKDIDFSFFGMNLAEIPQWNFMLKLDEIADPWVAFGMFMLPVISAALAYLAVVVGQKMNPTPMMESNKQMQTMNIVMPLMSLWFGFVMPAGMSVYWIANSVFGIAQDIWLTKRYRKQLDAEDAERIAAQKAKEEELQRKRAETERLRAENATERNKNTSRRKIQRKERSEDQEKAAEWVKKNKQEDEGTEDTDPSESSRVGNRKYARGRAYDPHRYDRPADSKAEELPEDTAAPSEQEDPKGE